MKVKRIYDHEAPPEKWADALDEKGESKKVPPVKCLRILHAGPRQKFSTKFIGGGTQDGWLELSGGVISIKTEEGTPLRYRVLREPGHFCCHCGQTVHDSRLGAAHVEKEHAGEASPDPNNPSGYHRSLTYECEREGD